MNQSWQNDFTDFLLMDHPLTIIIDLFKATDADFVDLLVVVQLYLLFIQVIQLVISYANFIKTKFTRSINKYLYF